LIDSPRIKLAGSLLFAGGMIFFIFNSIAEGIYPNYNVGVIALSDLGAIGAPTRFLWDGQLFFTGLLSLLGMYVLFFKSSWPDNIGMKNKKLVGIIYSIPTIGSILVSLFPENYILVIHSISAFVTFITAGVSAAYAYRLTRVPFRYFSITLGVITLVSIPFLGDRSLGFGLIERVVVYPFVLWTIAFGSYLMAQ
jgi:hypothetical membrane protein